MKSIHDAVDHKLFSEEDIDEMTTRLGKQLTKDYAGKRVLVVGALKGAIFFMVDLLKKMDLPCDIDFIDVSSYGNGTESSGKITVTHDLEADVTGRDVLIVEDIVDTGLTLKFMKDEMIKRGAKSVKCCVLLNKTARRTTEVEVEYYGTHVGNEFVIGYGMDFAGLYRNLPYVGVIKPQVVEEFSKKHENDN
ncbi:MAG: hypoxanthine phosphoribosyltransferase [Lactobacillus sp.]|jgi:hypoxanthine phosphoribosyltransferase|uniref:Hypoxanthine phosphoribosyltransferase n=1 Tax=Lactobacillus porci TaxID=2012477 RepID=A0A6A8MFG9_9LACO|nr:hypoxanthine phosphoribosyltransferase [Lactobacillus porci]MDD6416685.1 hypoxanthine phosphoribosyltransferase [Lactobacillus porci]MST87558.1 hypoxanthine phosphoribosyltransferase [Lactobacillus porci]